MVHVGDPDRWFQTVYTDAAKFGTKPDQYVGLRRMLEEFPDMTWIAAHIGGDPEHPDHLDELLERYPQLNFDTSATKWQVREVSPRREAIRDLICRRPDRFLFGSDLVTRPKLERDHYISRYWCQRSTMGERVAGTESDRRSGLSACGERTADTGVARPRLAAGGAAHGVSRERGAVVAGGAGVTMWVRIPILTLLSGSEY